MVLRAQPLRGLIGLYLAFSFYTIYGICNPQFDLTPGEAVLAPFWASGAQLNVTIWLAKDSKQALPEDDSVILHSQVVPFEAKDDIESFDLLLPTGLADPVVDYERVGRADDETAGRWAVDTATIQARMQPRREFQEGEAAEAPWEGLDAQLGPHARGLRRRLRAAAQWRPGRSPPPSLFAAARVDYLPPANGGGGFLAAMRSALPKHAFSARASGPLVEMGHPAPARPAVRFLLPHMTRHLAGEAHMCASMLSVRGVNGSLAVDMCGAAERPLQRAKRVLDRLGRGRRRDDHADGEGAVPLWVSQATVRLVHDQRLYPAREPPMQLFSWVPTVRVPAAVRSASPPAEEHPAGPSAYKPALYINAVSPPSEQRLPMNGSSAVVPLRVSLEVTPPGRVVLMHLMTQSMDVLKANMGASDRDVDDMIFMLTETPTWLLTLTFAVSVVHMLFDMLAFQSDLAFWAGARSLRGLSATMLRNAFLCDIVVALYLWSEEASMLVMVPQVLGLFLQAWKVLKSYGVVWSFETLRILPLPRYDRALASSANESRTNEHDSAATSHLTVMLGPVVVGFALYSLVFVQHSSWSRWVVTSAVGAVYTFGFILMTPQLYVNYKLKSVAALPWTAMLYRALNTFIDDLFAFIIRMPALARLSVFRDDIIFFIYIYQRFVYSVDSGRRYVDAEEQASGQAGLDAEEEGAAAEPVKRA